MYAIDKPCPQATPSSSKARRKKKGFPGPGKEGKQVQIRRVHHPERAKHSHEPRTNVNYTHGQEAPEVGKALHRGRARINVKRIEVLGRIVPLLN